MTGYLLRRLLLVMPTLFGIIAINFVVVQFAPGGPVEQMIAELNAAKATLSVAARLGASIGIRPAPAAIAARAGSIRTWSPTSRRCSASTSRRSTRFGEMVGGYLRFDFGRSFFRGETVVASHPAEDAG